jgi:hypothetical protein
MPTMRNNQRRALLWGVAFLTGCQDCDVAPVEDAPGSLKGTACHQVTGRPSIGAKVVVTADKSGSSTEYTGKADSRGAYQVDGIPPGQWPVRIDGEGIHVTFNVRILAGGMEERLDPMCIVGTQPVGTGCVAGQICNRHTGQIVSDAEVTVLLTNVNYYGDPTDLTGRTDDQGIFQICGVPVGTHVVQVRTVGFQKAFEAIVTENQTTTVATAPQCQRFDPDSYCTVQGRVCINSDPPGWLVGGRVTASLLDENGVLVSPVVTQEEEEYTDEDGRYEIFLRPAGKWRIQVLKGNFVSRHEVECFLGETVVIPETDQCVTASDCRFLVAQGMFDRVEEVLSRVGVQESRIDIVDGNPADLDEDWAFRAFGSYANLQSYCGVFFNCGITEGAFYGPQQNPVVVANLRRFVEEGGTLYASDQSYDIIEALYPAKVDWFGNDDLGSNAEYGLAGRINADVTDPGLLDFLRQENPAQETVEINFVYERWSLVQAVDPDVQVFLRANVQACADGEACTGALTIPRTPLTLRFIVGNQGGQVIFTAFHLETREATDGGPGQTLSTEDTDKVMRYLMFL